MPEQLKQFDFSKEEDQASVEQLPANEKAKIAKAAEEDAEWIENKAKKLAGGTDSRKVDYEKVENELEKYKQEFINYLHRDEINFALNFNNEFNLPETIVQDATKQRIIELLSNNYRTDDINYAKRIMDSFNLPDSIVQYAIKQGLVNLLSHDFNHGSYLIERNIEYVQKIKDKFTLSETVAKEAVKQAFINCLSRGGINALKIKDGFNLSEEIINSKEVQEAVKQGLITCLSDGDADAFIEIIDKFNLQETIINSSEIKEAIKRNFINHLSERHYIYIAIKIEDKFNLPKEIMFDPEFQEVANQEFIDCLSKSQIGTAIEIKDKFTLSETVAQEAAKQAFINCLSRGGINDALKIKDGFNLSEEIINSKEVQEAVKQGFAVHLLNDDFKEKLNLSEEIIRSTEVQEIPKQWLIDYLSLGCIDGDEGCIDFALKIKSVFNLNIIAQEAAKQAFINCLHEDDRLYYAKIIKNKFNLPENLMQETTKQELISCLSNGNIYMALLIKDEFNLSIPLQEIIEKIPKLVDLIEGVSQLAPEFKTQVEKSSDLAIKLCQFIKEPDQLINNLKENPFLLDAIANNPRFSPRLLIKYPEFDGESKKNIEKLFTAKNKIMAENPEMDSESLEFRQLMQEELKEFKNNSEIMGSIKEQGINLDEWLNYSETSYFNLSTGGSEIAFSEKIRTPIDRIKETIDSYVYTIKSVFKEYRPEMEKYEIVLEESRPIKEQIIKMEAALEQARAEGNEKKAQGIEKGLASQKEKLNNLKKGFLWDKLTGEVAAFQRLKNDCFDAQNRLMEAEKKLEGALSGKMPSGKMIQDIKQAITSAKEELRSKFSDLEGRIEKFKINLPKLIAPCLGQERSDGLIQEIDQKVAEQFDHFNSDRTTLANLFSERGDKEAEQLESRPMSIFVWARNPDIDLYQGNYSPCCICIDSTHMGAESTIADYNTDLGIQIVNIWDETKNEPVTAAWCWLGQNEKGEKALVVDNIESNTLFSSNFSEQLSKELFEYLKNYARKIGVDKVVLGKANNDLPTGSELVKLREDGNEYEKIGGSNRNSGYFLEAEETSVKLVWDKKQDKITKKLKTEKIKERKLTIKFENINAVGLTEKDLDKIRQLEAKIYKNTGLAQGLELIEDIKRGNGLEYSIILKGKNPTKEKEEVIGYIVAVEDETDEGDPSIYMEDVAVLNEVQGQGLGWEMLKELVNKLKVKAQKDGKPVLFDMSLREDGRKLMEKHKDNLEGMGVKLIEEALVPDYYDQGEDALYQVYQISAD